MCGRSRDPWRGGSTRKGVRQGGVLPAVAGPSAFSVAGEVLRLLFSPPAPNSPLELELWPASNDLSPINGDSGSWPWRRDTNVEP